LGNSTTHNLPNYLFPKRVIVCIPATTLPWKRGVKSATQEGEQTTAQRSGDRKESLERVWKSRLGTVNKKKNRGKKKARKKESKNPADSNEHFQPSFEKRSIKFGGPLPNVWGKNVDASTNGGLIEKEEKNHQKDGLHLASKGRFRVDIENSETLKINLRGCI